MAEGNVIDNLDPRFVGSNWDYCLSCNSSFIKFEEKIVTSIVFITKRKPENIGDEDRRRLVTPVLKLFDGEILDPLGFIDPNAKRLICDIDYRNALQISTFLSKGLSEESIRRHFVVTKDPNGGDSVWGNGGLSDYFEGGISMNLSANGGFMKTYDLVFNLKDSLMSEYRIYNAPLESIAALRDVIHHFALNRHAFYHEYLIERHLTNIQELISQPADA